MDRIELKNDEDFNLALELHADMMIDPVLPYDEIGEIVVVDQDENMISIIRDGRFVLDGTDNWKAI